MKIQNKIKYSATVKMPRNAKLNAENKRTYFPVFPFVFEVYSRKVIKLASEAMSVPAPPIFTPTSKGCQAVVNCDKRIADGTLLIT